MEDIIAALELDKNKPIIVANHLGLILYVNTAFEHLFQWNNAEITNLSLLTIIPRQLYDAHNLGFARFMATGSPTLLNKPIQLTAIKKNGEEFSALHTINAIKDNGQWIFGANISQEKE